jgi:hypothetical protein
VCGEVGEKTKGEKCFYCTIGSAYDLVVTTTVFAVGSYVDPVKALVWFWTIDETLSVLIIALSEYEIGLVRTK